MGGLCWWEDCSITDIVLTYQGREKIKHRLILAHFIVSKLSVHSATLVAWTWSGWSPPPCPSYVTASSLLLPGFARSCLPLPPALGRGVWIRLWNTEVMESGAPLFTILQILMKHWCASGSALDAGNASVG